MAVHRVKRSLSDIDFVSRLKHVNRAFSQFVKTDLRRPYAKPFSSSRAGSGAREVATHVTTNISGLLP